MDTHEILIQFTLFQSSLQQKEMQGTSKGDSLLYILSYKHRLQQSPNRQMEETQDLEDSVSLTANTHSSVRSVGPLTPGIISTHRMVQPTCWQEHTHRNTTLTWARVKALWIVWCHTLLWLWEVFAEKFTVVYRHTNSHKSDLRSIVLELQKKEAEWVFVSLTFFVLPHKICRISVE